MHNNTTITKMRDSGGTVLSQRGVVVPIVAIGLLALLAVAGMAIDSSHALTNKTRMQNLADASALAAAKELDETDGDVVLAEAEAHAIFALNADTAGNHELDTAYDAGDITVNVDFSVTVDPFVPGPVGPFVRVQASGFDTLTTLSRVLGINDIPTPASAVAGPSGPLGTGEGAELCDVAPIAVCTGDLPPDPSDPAAIEQLRVLKPNPGVHGDIGPGNYKMLRLGCSGGSCLRTNLAGSHEGCATVGEDVDTEPGVSSGPTSQGFNTRFNQYQGGGMSKPPYFPDEYVEEQGPDFLKSCEDPNDPLTEYLFLTSGGGNNYCNDFADGFDPAVDDPADWPQPYGGAGTGAGQGGDGDFVEIAPDINYNFCNYTSAGPGCNPNAPNPILPDGPGPLEPDGLANRRVLIFPTIECAGDQNGQSLLEVTGFACFFMLQALPLGQADGAGQIFGQYIDECEANGTSGTTPGGGPGPLLYKIQLYKDYDSQDS